MLATTAAILQTRLPRRLPGVRLLCARASQTMGIWSPVCSTTKVTGKVTKSTGTKMARLEIFLGGVPATTLNAETVSASRKAMLATAS